MRVRVWIKSIVLIALLVSHKTLAEGDSQATLDADLTESAATGLWESVSNRVGWIFGANATPGESLGCRYQFNKEMTHAVVYEPNNRRWNCRTTSREESLISLTCRSGIRFERTLFADLDEDFGFLESTLCTRGLRIRVQYQ